MNASKESVMFTTHEEEHPHLFAFIMATPNKHLRARLIKKMLEESLSGHPPPLKTAQQPPRNTMNNQSSNDVPAPLGDLSFSHYA